MAEPLAVESRRLAQSGHFASLVMAEQKRLFLLCQRMLGDRAEADSATQDVFLKAYKALQKEGGEIQETGQWLTRIAVNTCLDRLRSRRWQFWRKRPAPEDESLILSMTASQGPTAEDQVFALEIHKQLYRALGRLTGRQRAIFMLKHFEDRSLEEIGVTLGLDTGTVKAHMARAVAKLRVELKDLYLSLGRRNPTTGGGGK